MGVHMSIRTPMEALAQLRASDNGPVVQEQVVIFNGMSHKDRLEFLFRTSLALSVQQANIINALSDLKRLVSTLSRASP